MCERECENAGGVHGEARMKGSAFKILGTEQAPAEWRESKRHFRIYVNSCIHIE
jgi:hypothetical protein